MGGRSIAAPSQTDCRIHEVAEATGSVIEHVDAPISTRSSVTASAEEWVRVAACGHTQPRRRVGLPCPGDHQSASRPVCPEAAARRRKRASGACTSLLAPDGRRSPRGASMLDPRWRRTAPTAGSRAAPFAQIQACEAGARRDCISSRVRDRRAIAKATFRVLAKGDFDGDAALASAVGSPQPPRSLTPHR
jgi:hypothetical protein